MDALAQLDLVVELFERLEIDVRREHLGGDGGGLCQVPGKRMVFIDLDADNLTQLAQSVRALASLPELPTIQVAPALRELILRSKEIDTETW